MKPLSARNVILLAALALVAAGIAAYMLRPATLERAPQLVYVTVEGELIIPRDLQDQVVLVNFWATDCTACLKEMPKLVETFRKYRPLGLRTIAVAMSYDRPDLVLSYQEKNRLPFKVALDIHGDAARGFGNVTATPTLFVVDKHGNIARRFIGEPDFAELDRLIEQKLAEPA